VRKLAIYSAVALFSLGSGAYLASGIFLSLIGGDINQATPWLIYQYGEQYPDNEAVMLKIYGSLAAAFVLVGGVAVLLLMPKKESLHGDAKFATKREIKAAGLHVEQGIIIGKREGGYLVYDGPEFMSLYAPTRSGKGVSTVIPNCLNWHDSLFVLDIKKENWELTAGFREENGQRCFLFDPMSYQTHCWNPFAYMSVDSFKRIDDIQKIAHMIWAGKEGDDIWAPSARSLFLGITLFIAESGDLPMTLGEVLRQGIVDDPDGNYWKDLVRERRLSNNALSDVCGRALLDYCSTSNNTRNSIRKTFTAALELWFNPIIDAATSSNDFDFRTLRTTPQSIYLAVQPKDIDRLKPVINLFCQQLIDSNLDTLYSDDPKEQKKTGIKHRLLLMLDEFPAIGKIPIFPRAVGFIAGYGLRVCIIAQSPAQIRAIYGPDDSKAINDNMALTTVFTPAPRDNETPKEISEYMGYKTVKARTKGKSGVSMASKSHSINDSDQRRALLLPQEISQLPTNKQIVLLRGLKPFISDKVKWYTDKSFLGRQVKAPPVPFVNPIKLHGKADYELRSVETVQDLEELDDLSYEDVSMNFDDIALPPGVDLSDADMEGLVDEILAMEQLVA
jgi:type IV secretion system protein VirD4